jgi:iron complex transport system permease protein
MMKMSSTPSVTYTVRHAHRRFILVTVLLVLLVALFLLNLFIGTVNIPAYEVVNALVGNEVSKASWQYIIMESRLPSALTALFCGASLAVSGLMLQTTFRNPLAGPSILGITNGASLGVGIVMLLLGGTVQTTVLGADIQLGGIIAVILAAFVGAIIIMGILLLMSTLVRNNLMLLIVGIMVGYLTSSFVSLLNIFATSDNLFSYVVWSMGSFSGVTLQQLPYFIIPSVVGLLLALAMIKPLNAFLLGDEYAQNLGFSIMHVRTLLLCSTGLLTAISTAFCGPVAFIGLATPHIARLICGNENHKQLLPATIIMGAVIALLCNILCMLPNETILPLNAITPIIGTPVILYVILCRR